MSLLDTYRGNVNRRTDELNRIQQDKAKEQGKIAVLTAKINVASQAQAKATNPSIIKSRSNEIQRYRSEQAAAEKRLADLGAKFARKQKELGIEQKKVSKEEEIVEKKRLAESQKQVREHQMQMSRIGSTITKHDSLHMQTLTLLEKLQKLPERIVVLFLASNPLDQQQLRLDEEARSIGDMIRRAKHRDSVQFETRWAVQPLDVLQSINELNPTVVHFSGHGSDADEIVFQDSNGNAKGVSKEAIVQLMIASSGSIRLVFFNTCFSFNQARAVTTYVEAAIGMNTSIGDDAARLFASQFYSALGFGLSIKKAFEQAKALVMMESIPEESTPELFVQEGLDANEIVIVRPENK